MIKNPVAGGSVETGWWPSRPSLSTWPRWQYWSAEFDKKTVKTKDYPLYIYINKNIYNILYILCMYACMHVCTCMHAMYVM